MVAWVNRKSLPMHSYRQIKLDSCHGDGELNHQLMYPVINCFPFNSTARGSASNLVLTLGGALNLAYKCQELVLATRARHDRTSNPRSHDCETSDLPLSNPTSRCPTSRCSSNA